MLYATHISLGKAMTDRYDKQFQLFVNTINRWEQLRVFICPAVETPRREYDPLVTCEPIQLIQYDVLSYAGTRLQRSIMAY